MFPIRDHNPSGRVAYVTYSLIAINCFIFLTHWGDINNARVILPLYDKWALIPTEIGHATDLHTLFTSTFLHGSLLHLAGNMLFLHIFGDNLEDEMGHVGFLVFYILCGIGASLFYFISTPNSNIPLIGASGAIAGIMGGYLLLYPKAKVDVFFFFIVFFRIIPISAWIVLSVWFGIQLYNGAMTPSGQSGVAYWAHIGGFIVGLILCLPRFMRHGGQKYWSKNHGLPPHPEKIYVHSKTNIPTVRRKRGPWK